MELNNEPHASSSMRSVSASSNSNRFSLERELEEELQLELQKLEDIFISEHQEETSDVLQDSAKKRSKLSYSAYEYAEAEAEKEELQDKLQLLLSKTEEFDSQLAELNQLNMDLKAENKRIDLENMRLKKQLTEAMSKKEVSQESSKGNYDALGSDPLMLKLAEVQEKLIRSEQDYDDLSLAKEAVVRELEHERMTRIHIEKERDAYSAAYEASIHHFEKKIESDIYDASEKYTFTPRISQYAQERYERILEDNDEDADDVDPVEAFLKRYYEDLDDRMDKFPSKFRSPVREKKWDKPPFHVSTADPRHLSTHAYW